MSSRTDNPREFRRERALPWVAVCLGALVVSFSAGELLEGEFHWGTLLVGLVFVGGAATWAGWGMWVLLDRRPRVVTDRQGIAVPLHAGGPLRLGWGQISSLTCDVRTGHLNAVLRIVAEADGEVAEHVIRIGGLDAPPQAIFDHVLTCHAEFGAKPVESPRPAGGASRKQQTRTFLPRRRLVPFDLRLVGTVLAVLGLTGVAAGYAAGGAAGVVHGWAAPVTAASMATGLAGLVVLVINLKTYGTGPLPPEGWPRLTVGAGGITLAEGPNDELFVPWDRVREVVRLSQEYSGGNSAVLGVAVYYLAPRGKVKQFTIGLDRWEDPHGVLHALLNRGAEDESGQIN